MRKTRIAQASIFENYSKHEFGARLRALSNRLDQYPEILRLVADDLRLVYHLMPWALNRKHLFDYAISGQGSKGISQNSKGHLVHRRSTGKGSMVSGLMSGHRF
ncbi:hypothetical protein ATI45_2827 [Marinobacter sp. LV10MA510-1]|nr:hypothetical protein ATI45_2827 [Marinobacter sp. LV10MA510-1]